MQTETRNFNLKVWCWVWSLLQPQKERGMETWFRQKWTHRHPISAACKVRLAGFIFCFPPIMKQEYNTTETSYFTAQQLFLKHQGWVLYRCNSVSTSQTELPRTTKYISCVGHKNTEWRSSVDSHTMVHHYTTTVNHFDLFLKYQHRVKKCMKFNKRWVLKYLPQWLFE